MKVLRQRDNAAKYLTRRGNQRLGNSGKDRLTVPANVTIATAVTAAIILAGVLAPSIAAVRLMLFLLARAFVAMAVMRAGFAMYVIPAMTLIRRGRSHGLAASRARLGSHAGYRKGNLPLQKSEHQHGAREHG